MIKKIIGIVTIYLVVLGINFVFILINDVFSKYSIWKQLVLAHGVIVVLLIICVFATYLGKFLEWCFDSKNVDI